MRLRVISTTLREVLSDTALFPAPVRQTLCDAVGSIAAADLPPLLAKHESDPANFDGTIESVLRQANPDLSIKANHTISGGARFNNDLVIETDGASICLEIEKGTLSRFEFDILKMQAFACANRSTHGHRPVFGAFIVPDDNVVARHISGNSGESSYRYVRRLLRLVAQAAPSHVEDILVIGYAVDSQADQEVTPVKDDKLPKKQASNVISVEAGLLSEEVVRGALRGLAIEPAMALRAKLQAACPKLREKLNTQSRYLGYGLSDGSDALYVYVQRDGLLLDVKVSTDRADEMRHQGFDVKPRANYQSKIGWLTGLKVPEDTMKLDVIASLAVEALSGTAD